MPKTAITAIPGIGKTFAKDFVRIGFQCVEDFEAASAETIFEALGTLCITLARLWQSDRDELQGVFLQPIARLLARKTTQQIARFRLITDRRELCRGSLRLLPFYFAVLKDYFVTLLKQCRYWHK